MTCVVVVIYCELPSNPENGAVNMTGLHYGSIAISWCLTGYDLIGNDTAVCETTGYWSDTTLTCVKSPGQFKKIMLLIICIVKL